MKHKLKITLFLLIIFILAQVTGLLVTASYKKFFLKEGKEKIESMKIQNVTNVSETKIKKTIEKTNISITKKFIPEKVELKTSFDILGIIVSFIIALIFATVVFIILMKIGIIRAMRIWFFLVVVVGLFICFSLLFYNVFNKNIKIFNFYFNLSEILALVLAVFFGYYKIYKRDIIVHNLTEIFVYPGIIILFLPIVNIWVVLGLLVLISIYDVIAVFKTKHMQRMANFMIKDVRAFAGVLLPYLSKKEKEKIKKLKKRKNKQEIKVRINLAALGGGDIAFPMLFASTVFLGYSIFHSIFIIVFSTIALAFLLFFGKKGKAYPALPPLAIGSIIGFIISTLIF